MTRTRFAPSPTGYLHIGGVRTALFNWLVARQSGGQFVLRIDDTDLGRNRPEAVQPILDGFQWLGLNWDEGPADDAQSSFGPYAPYFQSRRNNTYIEAARKLIETGHAYPDSMTPEEQTADRVDKHLATYRAANPGASAGQLQKESDAAAKGQRPYTFRGRLRDADPAENLKAYDANPGPVRFKVPTGRAVTVTDLIRGRSKDGGPGRVEFATDGIGDPVILRGPNPDDGVCRPLYNFATVVDEINMKLTHVIRAAEHFSNTPGQVLMFEALGATPPVFAHVPVVNAPNSKEKLSKRKMAQFMTPEVVKKLRAVHAVPAEWSDDQVKSNEALNPVTVEFYKILGYLPSAVINYLSKLGWSMDDATEYMTVDNLIKNFTLETVNEAAASFDPDKLHWLAGEHMARLPVAERVHGSLPFLRRAGLIGELVTPETVAMLQDVFDAAGDRIKLFSDAIQYAGPFLGELPEYDAKAVTDKLKKPGVGERLQAVRGVLEKLETFDSPAISAAINGYAAEHGLKPKDLDAPARIALTGTPVGVALPDAIRILGRDKVLRRLDHALTLAG